MADTNQLNELPRIRSLLESINAQLRRPPPPGGPPVPPGGPGGPGPGGPGGPNPPPDGSRSEPKKKKGIVSETVEKAGSILSGGIIGTMVGALAMGVKNSIDSAKQYDAILRRSGSLNTQSYEQIKNSVATYNKGTGLVHDEFAKLSVAISKVSGSVTSTEGSMKGAQAVAMMARGYGMDTTKTGESMGRMSVMSGTDVTKQANIFGQAFSRFGMVRTEQYLDDILEFSEKQVATTAQASEKEIKAFMDLRGFFEQEGGPLGGENAARIIANATEALQHPGGGVAGEAFMMQVASRMEAKGPSGAEYLREEGLFHREKEGGPTTLDTVNTMVKEMGLDRMQQLAVYKTLGFGTMHQVEQFNKIYEKMTPEKKKEFEKTYEDRRKSGQGTDWDNYDKISKASDNQIMAWAKMGDAKLKQMASEGKTDEARSYMLENFTVEKTPASMLTDATVGLQNAVMKLTDNAIPGLTIAAELGAKVAEGAGAVMVIVGQYVEGAVKTLSGWYEKLSGTSKEQAAKEKDVAKSITLKKEILDTAAAPGGNLKRYSNKEMNALLDSRFDAYKSKDPEKIKAWEDKLATELGLTKEQIEAQRSTIDEDIKATVENTAKMQDLSGEMSKLSQAFQAAKDKWDLIASGGVQDPNQAVRDAIAGSGGGGGTGGGGGAPWTGDKKATAQHIMERLVKAGYSPEDAAAMVGNLDAESGLNPNAVNPSSGAYGLKQGLGSRKLPYGTSLDDQIDDIIKEQQGSENNSYKQLQNAKSLNDKVYAVGKYYESPSDAELSSSMNRRISSAQQALDNFKNPQSSKSGYQSTPADAQWFTGDLNKLNGMDPATVAKMKAASKSAQTKLPINSGYRTQKYQDQLRADAVKKYGSEEAASKWVARKSIHTSGYAADIGDKNWWAKNKKLVSEMENQGLHRPMAHEPWHWEDSVTKGRQRNGLMDQLIEERNRSGSLPVAPGPSENNPVPVAPPPPVQAQQTAALGGEINLNLIHRDRYGRLLKDPVAHQMNLRGNRLDGEFSVEGINPQAFA